MFASLSPITRRRRVRQTSPIQFLQQSPLNSSVFNPFPKQLFTSSPAQDRSPIQMTQYPLTNMKELILQLQQKVEALQHDATRQAEVAARQAKVITRLQQ